MSRSQSSAADLLGSIQVLCVTRRLGREDGFSTRIGHPKSDFSAGDPLLFGVQAEVVAE